MSSSSRPPRLQPSRPVPHEPGTVGERIGDPEQALAFRSSVRNRSVTTNAYETLTRELV